MQGFIGGVSSKQAGSHRCLRRFDIEGARTKHGSEEVCSSSADVLETLLEAGAEFVGRTTTEELNLG